jgi:hypothetical protein
LNDFIKYWKEEEGIKNIHKLILCCPNILFHFYIPGPKLAPSSRVSVSHGEANRQQLCPPRGQTTLSKIPVCGFFQFSFLRHGKLLHVSLLFDGVINQNVYFTKNK